MQKFIFLLDCADFCTVESHIDGTKNSEKTEMGCYFISRGKKNMAFAQGKYVVCPDSIAAEVFVCSKIFRVTYLLVLEYNLET